MTDTIPPTDTIGDLLDSISLDMQADSEAPLDTTSPTELINIITLPDDQIDPRLQLLSHSSRTTLHKCPRKYQLYRLSSQQISLASEKETEQGVTFAYGTAVGVGVQSVLEKKTIDQVFLDTFLAWDVDLLDNNPRQKKSFWLAMFAVQKFASLQEDGFLEDYELVYYKGKPAVELSFQIVLPNEFKYRGFVDAVLQHKTTGKVMVLECKTSSGTANPATFKNSGQALGYSVVLDILFPALSSYEVLYLVYETKSYEYKELPFEKSLLQRALWLQELLVDCQMVELYESYKTYPMHGENCFDFFRECEYLGLCTLNTANLTKPLTQDILDKIEKDAESYDFNVDFYELVAAQVAKGKEV
jgi:hypothetical protein